MLDETILDNAKAARVSMQTPPSPNLPLPTTFKCLSFTSQQTRRPVEYCISLELGRKPSVGGSSGVEHTAMTTQQMLTYGLSLSPIRAHFQKMPNTLSERISVRVVHKFGDLFLGLISSSSKTTSRTIAPLGLLSLV